MKLQELKELKQTTNKKPNESSLTIIKDML